MKRVYKIGLLLAAAAAVTLALTACSPSQPAAPRLRVEVTAPATRATVTEPEVVVTGIVSDPTARLTVKDAPVSVGSDGAFSHAVPLAYGANSIAVRATKEGQNPVSRTLTITRNLVLDISSPLDNSASAEDLVTVIGRVSDPMARVYINGTGVDLDEAGAFSSPVTLYYAATTINITTALDGVDPITKLVTVTKP